MIQGDCFTAKTAVARAIAARLTDAITLSFDRYETATGQPVQTLKEWLARGADFDEFVVSPLREDLRRLKRGEAIRDPTTQAKTSSAKHVVFEYPLGREARSLAPFIDLLIWVEVPLDVALARKLKELIGTFVSQDREEKYGERLLWLDRYLENYLAIVRDILEIQPKRVAAQADLVLPGMRRLHEIAKEAADLIRLPFPWPGLPRPRKQMGVARRSGSPWPPLERGLNAYGYSITRFHPGGPRMSSRRWPPPTPTFPNC